MKPALAAIASLVLLSGCGSEGVAENATLSVYVSASLCADAKRELGGDGRASDVHLRTVCVDDTAEGGGSELAAIGAAARRATEDSSSVAYIGTPDPVSVRFSEPILEEAGIPRVSNRSGAVAMETLLRALERAERSGSLRESLRDELP